MSNYKSIGNTIVEYLELCEVLQIEKDEQIKKDLENNLSQISNDIKKFEIELLLSKKYDKNHAIVSINAGSRRSRITRLGSNYV